MQNYTWIQFSEKARAYGVTPNGGRDLTIEFNLIQDVRSMEYRYGEMLSITQRNTETAAPTDIGIDKACQHCLMKTTELLLPACTNIRDHSVRMKSNLKVRTCSHSTCGSSSRRSCSHYREEGSTPATASFQQANYDDFVKFIFQF